MGNQIIGSPTPFPPLILVLLSSANTLFRLRLFVYGGCNAPSNYRVM